MSEPSDDQDQFNRPKPEDLTGVTVVFEGPEDTTIRPIPPEMKRQREEFQRRMGKMSSSEE